MTRSRTEGRGSAHPAPLSLLLRRGDSRASRCYKTPLCERTSLPPGPSLLHVRDIGGPEIKVGVQPHLLRTLDRLIPLRRGGTREEAANAVYLFCTPESNSSAVQVVVAGGGLLM